MRTGGGDFAGECSRCALHRCHYRYSADLHTYVCRKKEGEGTGVEEGRGGRERGGGGGLEMSLALVSLFLSSHEMHIISRLSNPTHSPPRERHHYDTPCSRSWVHRI